MNINKTNSSIKYNLCQNITDVNQYIKCISKGSVQCTSGKNKK